MKKNNASLRKYNEEMRKLEIEKGRQHEQRLNDLRKYNEEMRKLEIEKERQHELRLNEMRNETIAIEGETDALRQPNARLAELERKLDIVLSSSDSSLTPTPPTNDD